MGVFDGTINTLPANWSLVMGQSGLSASFITSRAQGYTATSAVAATPIRATTYTAQASAAQRSIVSTSANDTSAGTGARTVTINYLDASFVSHSETITLNGTTAVNTVGTNYQYIENIVVATVGSGGSNAGTIQLWTSTGGAGSVFGSIAIGDNQTFWAHHYVPSGVTCYITVVSAGSTAVAGQTDVTHFGNLSVANLPQLQIGVTIMHGSSATTDHNYDIPIAVPGPDLILLQDKPNSNGTNTVVAGFEYLQF